MKQIFPGKRAFHLDEGYSGPLRSTPYFEGWYLRQVTSDKSRSLAVIIGLSLAPDPHAFIRISGDLLQSVQEWWRVHSSQRFEFLTIAQ